MPERQFDWSPTIGDPTLVGWLTVIAYVVTAWLCLRAFMVEKSGPPRPYRSALAALFRVVKKHHFRPPRIARRALLWVVIAGVMGSLGINKQLDLQSLVTEIGRVVAYEGGWYDSRATVQVLFVIGVGIAGLCGVALVAWLVRDSIADFRLALLGLLWLGAFILIRASSFHHVDQLIHSEAAGVQFNWVFELSGIGVIALSAARRIRAADRPVFGSWKGQGEPEPDKPPGVRITQLHEDGK